MRMQLSAPWFVEQIRQWPRDARAFDAVLCSTFVDVALLRSLLSQVSGWQADTRFLTYFHENQFAYPGQVQSENMYQFTALNFSSAMASDACAFNSDYNRRTFFEGVTEYLGKASDMNLELTLPELERKCQVLAPGLDYTEIDGCSGKMSEGPPVIVWNHRWEHDKDPQTFFNALYELEELGVPFRLIVLGQSFRYGPSCFAEARGRLQAKTIHFGYAESREEYVQLLRSGDVVVSTALHEFFGLAVLEAVRAGCRPLLPHRLSYPELFPEKYLYQDGQLVQSLSHLLSDFQTQTDAECKDLTERHGWPLLLPAYNRFLFG